MKKIFLYYLFMGFVLTSCSQIPQTQVHVFSRVTQPGIKPDPQNNNNIFPKKYFIYTEVKKASKVEVEGYWIDGKFYSARGSEKVSSPVIITDMTIVEQKDTLVKKTSNDVYKIVPGEEKTRETQDEAEKKSVTENQFVLVIKVNGKLQFISVEKIKELSPAAMM